MSHPSEELDHLWRPPPGVTHPNIGSNIFPHRASLVFQTALQLQVPFALLAILIMFSSAVITVFAIIFLFTSTVIVSVSASSRSVFTRQLRALRACERASLSWSLRALGSRCCCASSGHPSLENPSLAHPSLGHLSLGHPSLAQCTSISWMREEEDGLHSLRF